jgi:hypothetical protein
MRRISLVTAAVAICVLAFGVVGPAVAGAKSTHKAYHSKAVKITATCNKLLLSDVVPAAETGITPPLASGTQFGTVGCGGKLGSGLAAASFTVQDTGDITGSIALYFGTGGIKGTYDLSQAANQPLPTPYTFGNADYTGTVKVTGGFGAYAKAKGTATFSCDTLDSVHYSCSERLKLTLPAKKTS